MKLRRLETGEKLQKTKPGFFDNVVRHSFSLSVSVSIWRRFGLAENPGLAYCQAAYHDSVAVLAAAPHFLSRGNVAVAGQGNTEFLSEGGNIVPAGLAPELFSGGSGVKGYEIKAFFLKAAAKAYQVFKIVGKAGTQFDAEPAMSFGPEPADKRPGSVYIGHPAYTCAGSPYSRGGTAHIYINPQTFPPIQQDNGTEKLIRISANDLVDQFFRARAVVGVPFLKRPPIYKSAGADHFGKVFVSAAETFNQFPQGPVAQFRHGS
jgi:hypothetical protein